VISGVMAILQKGAITVPSVKMVPKEETTGRVTDRHATNSELGRGDE